VIPRHRVASYYDQVMYRSLALDAYEGSDFQNLGLWTPGTSSLPAACESLVDSLLTMLPERPGRVLDVACGKGATTRRVADRGGAREVVAVNISVKQLSTARRNAPGCQFLAMDASKLAFADESFDNVICVEAACHFVTRESFLRECRRILKPGGRLVFSDLLISRWMEKFAPGRRGANYLSDPDAYTRLCLEAGFDQAQVWDRTEECWSPFLRHYMAFLSEQHRQGQITSRVFKATMGYAWVMIYAARYYVLGWAERKPLEDETR